MGDDFDANSTSTDGNGSPTTGPSERARYWLSVTPTGKSAPSSSPKPVGEPELVPGDACATNTLISLAGEKTAHVDKKLTGLTAVQTLSRGNRIHPHRHDTFVLDYLSRLTLFPGISLLNDL